MASSPVAKVITDSISPQGVRLITVEATHHRFVLAEENTHRVFSRNSASSRAIPVEKQMARVREDAALPLVWPCEQPGMSGGADLQGDLLWDAQGLFESVRASTVELTQDYLDSHPEKEDRLHKSLINRLLEPFQWHTVIITSSAWDNFFAQRCHPAAQPEMRAVAEQIEKAIVNSRPQELEVGDYHLPYIMPQDWETIYSNDPSRRTSVEVAKKVSAARCARVSYLTQDGVRDISEDLKLYDRLRNSDPMHASPFEHIATPAPWNIQTVTVEYNGSKKKLTLPKVGNFLGWQQHRLEVEIEKDAQSFR